MANTKEKKAEWLADRIKTIKAKKNATEQEELLVLLTELDERTTEEEKKLAALIKAEKAEKVAREARTAITTTLNNEKEAARKKRNHKMFQVAGLVGLVGVVDSSTGEFAGMGKDEFVGALLAMMNAPKDDPKRGHWKQAGRDFLKQNSGSEPV